jgi:hypothetical protein
MNHMVEIGKPFLAKRLAPHLHVGYPPHHSCLFIDDELTLFGLTFRQPWPSIYNVGKRRDQIVHANKSHNVPLL